MRYVIVVLCIQFHPRDMLNAALASPRKYYEMYGEQRPGRKGICLTIDQYNVLRSLIVDGILDQQIGELEG